MIWLIKFIKIILMLMLDLFPDTPFPDAVDGMDTAYLVYLNWFFPLDVCLNLFVVWVNCMLIILVIKIVWKLLLDKFMTLIKMIPLPK